MKKFEYFTFGMYSFSGFFGGFVCLFQNTAVCIDE